MRSCPPTHASTLAPQVVPRQLGAAGRLVSETTAMVLTAIRAVQGKDYADDLAAGYVDGAARYWADEYDRTTGRSQAAE